MASEIDDHSNDAVNMVTPAQRQRAEAWMEQRGCHGGSMLDDLAQLLAKARREALEEADRGGRRKWIREKPTEPGWYWWQRSANDEPVVVHITDLHADKILRIEYPQGDYGRLSNCTGSFQGPITPREDAP